MDNSRHALPISSFGFAYFTRPDLGQAQDPAKGDGATAKCGAAAAIPGACGMSCLGRNLGKAPFKDAHAEPATSPDQWTPPAATTSASGEADPNGLSASTPGAKLDAGKVNLWLMFHGFYPALAQIERALNVSGFQLDEHFDPGYLDPVPPIALATNALRRWPDAMREVARVTNAGAKKYSPNGWKQVENGPERYLGALLRHVSKIDQVTDEDTGCLHLAQVVWNALAVATLAHDAETHITALTLALHYLDGLQEFLDTSDYLAGQN